MLSTAETGFNILQQCFPAASVRRPQSEHIDIVLNRYKEMSL